MTTFGGPFGGIGSLPKDVFEGINGFSNDFFGWGGEDQEIGKRLGNARDIAKEKLKNQSLNPYLKINFDRDTAIKSWQNIQFSGTQGDGDTGNEINPARITLLSNFTKRWPYDGLNTMEYTVLDKQQHSIQGSYNDTFLVHKKTPEILSMSNILL